MVLGSFSVVGEVVLGGGHHDHQRVVPFGDDQRGTLVSDPVDQTRDIAVDLGQRNTNDLFHRGIPPANGVEAKVEPHPAAQ